MSDARENHELPPAEDDSAPTNAQGRFDTIHLRDVYGRFPPLLRPATAESISPDPQKYLIQGEVARGGIGIIVKGHDRDLGRDVALKFLRKRHRRDPESLQRFVEEAQVGGQLQHPGIVPVYDLGVEEGAPYFTMQLIEGETLAALLAERAKPIDDRARCLDIFEAVCRTMAYAHVRGVVHRDLKPANIMLGRFGEVFVVDWGLAKVLARGGTADEKRQHRQQPETQPSSVSTVRKTGPAPAHSTAGSVMGTPAYMPPEQARGDVEAVDERSDVFALGALLCEILTGSPPYPSGQDNTLQLAERCATEQALSRLAQCDADASLVELCERCLRAAPSERPRDAGVLAESVASYRHSVEERARSAQISAAEERVRATAAKRSQRQTLALAASILLTLTLTGFGLWWSERAKDKRMARSARAVEAELLAASEARDRGLLNVEHDAIERAVALVEASELRPELRQRVQRAHARIAGELRERAFMEELAQIAVSAASIDESTANSESQIAARCAAYRRAFAQQGVLVDEPSRGALEKLRGSPRAAEIAAALDDWADAATLLKRARGAGGHDGEFLAVLDLALAIDDDPLRRRLRTWWRKHPDGAGNPRELDALLEGHKLLDEPPMTAIAIAFLLRRCGSAERAYEILSRMAQKHPQSAALALRAGWACQHPSVAKHVEAIRHLSVAVALSGGAPYPQQLLGVSLARIGRYREAEFHFRRSIEAGIRSPQARSNLGLTLGFAGHLDEAESLLREALKHDEANLSAHIGLGMVLALKDRTQEAHDFAKKALSIAPRSAHAYAHLAWLQDLGGRHEESLASYRRAAKLAPHDKTLRLGIAAQLGALGQRGEQVKEYEAILDSQPNDVAAHLNLARALERTDDTQRALHHARRAVETEPNNAHAHALLGIVLAKRNIRDGAMRSLERALELDQACGEALTALAGLLVGGGKLEDAQRLYQRVLATSTARASVQSVVQHLRRPRAARIQRVHARRGLARILCLQKRYSKAVPHLESLLAQDATDVAALELLAQCYTRLQERQKSLATLQRLVKLAPRNWRAQFNLAVELKLAGQYSSAITAYERVLEIDPKQAMAWVGIGTVRSSQREYEAAVAAYQRALSLDDKSLHARVFLANTYLRLSKLDRAEPLLRDALALDRAAIAADSKLRAVFARAANWAGAAHNSERDWHAALSLLRGAVSVDPGHAPAHVNLAVTLAGSRRLRAAIASYRRARALFDQRDDAFAQKWRHEATRRIALIEKQIEAANAMLDSIRNGAAPSGSEDERLASAALAFEQEEYGLAVRCYRDAFAAFPRLLTKTSSSIDAARAAIRAATDNTAARSPNSESRAALRALALEWAQAGLAVARARARRRPSIARAIACRILEDRVLAETRANDSALEAEARKEWRDFWKATQRLASELEARTRRATEVRR